MRDERHARLLLGGQRRGGRAAALVLVVAVAVVMDRDEILHAPAHRSRKIVVGRVLVREDRVPADFRQSSIEYSVVARAGTARYE
jgi:hypothetical protein